MQVLRKTRHWIAAIGLILIVMMFGVELLPNTNSGFGPLQLVGIVIGLMIIILSQIKTSILGLIAIIGVSILVTTIILEFGVGILGYEADYTAEMIAQSQQMLVRAPYWTCDTTQGCRFIAEGILDDMCPGTVPDKISRFCIINSQGYNDTDEFAASPELEAADYRILLLGDSFTFGSGAEFPMSFADLLTAHMQTEHNGIVWNSGIPGSATRQALQLAREYVPIMKPDLVILGFFANDFHENLYPIDLYVSPLIDDDYRLVYAYVLDGDFVPQRLTDSNIYFRAVGQPTSHSQAEVWLRQTRLGSLGLNSIPGLSSMTNPDRQWDESVRQTQILLQELQAYLETEDVPLIVLHIPTIDDMQSPTRTYTTFQEISDDLELNILEVRENLTIDDYFPLPDGHWRNSGHAKASEIILACLDFMLENPTTICPDVVN